MKSKIIVAIGLIGINYGNLDHDESWMGDYRCNEANNQFATFSMYLAVDDEDVSFGDACDIKFKSNNDNWNTNNWKDCIDCGIGKSQTAESSNVNTNDCYCGRGSIPRSDPGGKFYWRGNWQCRRGNAVWHRANGRQQTRNCGDFCKNLGKLDCGRTNNFGETIITDTAQLIANYGSVRTDYKDGCWCSK